MQVEQGASSPGDGAAPRPDDGDAGIDGPRERAAAAVRALGHALLAHDVDARLLEQVAAELPALTRQAERAGPRHRDVTTLTERMFGRAIGDREPVVHFDECVVCGPWNPLGVGIEVERDGDAVAAAVVLGHAFEGGPGMAHGGVVAALFDDLLGYLLTVHRFPAFTGALTVRYHRPTPVERRLELRGRVVGRDQRHLHTVGEIRVDGLVVATAEATFVRIDAARLAADS